MSPDPTRIMVAGSGTSEGLFVALATPDIPKIRVNVHNNKTLFTPAPLLCLFYGFAYLLCVDLVYFGLGFSICKYHAEPDIFFTPLNFN